MFDVIFVIVAGFTTAYVALMFMYSNMNEWQRKLFKIKSMAVEVVFFFAPFGLALVAQSTNAMLMSLGFGLGLSAFSASVKAQHKAKIAKEVKFHMNKWNKLSDNEKRNTIFK